MVKSESSIKFDIYGIINFPLLLTYRAHATVFSLEIKSLRIIIHSYKYVINFRLQVFYFGIYKTIYQNKQHVTDKSKNYNSNISMSTEGT